jgi:hypothetical protein
MTSNQPNVQKKFSAYKQLQGEIRAEVGDLLYLNLAYVQKVK